MTGKQKTMLATSAMTIALLAGCSSNTTTEEAVQQNNRMKPEIIKNEGKYGTIREERVRAMSSEARYIPNGSKEGYALIDPTLADSKENAHRDVDQPVIASFTIGRW